MRSRGHLTHSTEKKSGFSKAGDKDFTLPKFMVWNTKFCEFSGRKKLLNVSKDSRIPPQPGLLHFFFT